MAANLMIVSGISFSALLLVTTYKVFREVNKDSGKRRIIKYTFKKQ